MQKRNRNGFFVARFNGEGADGVGGGGDDVAALVVDAGKPPAGLAAPGGEGLLFEEGGFGRVWVAGREVYFA